MPAGSTNTMICTVNEDDELRLVLERCGFASAPDVNVPLHSFSILLRQSGNEAGKINLRAGYTENIELYRGNIGFTVHEGHRGHGYATKACLLLLPFIRELGLSAIYLTCNHTNIASQKSIERLPVSFLGEMRIDDGSPFSAYYGTEARIKLRYVWRIE